MARTYKQECILAHALDLLGERWTLLILRDLLLGPRRFGDLQASLPGIGANLLSKRLKELEEAGLIETSGPIGNRNGYSLSRIGADLRPVILSLMRWSLHYFMTRAEASKAYEYLRSDDLQPDSVALAIEMFAESNHIPALSYVARINIDDYAYTVYYMNEEMTIRRGADAPAVATISSNVATMLHAFRGELSREQVMKKITLEGDENALDHLLRCITLQDVRRPNKDEQHARRAAAR